MRGPGLPSIDQLTVFLSVVETGSFAAAGRKLGRATSAISYTIAPGIAVSLPFNFPPIKGQGTT
jgi:Bacterial regulatory helix-turn-helix protein, lysR family